MSDGTSDSTSKAAPGRARKAWVRLVRSWDIFCAINGTLWAASFSYYAFFALFPLLAFMIAVAAHFMDAAHAFRYISDFAGRFMPLDEQDRAAIARTVNGVINARGRVGVLSLLGLMWSAIGFFQAVVGAVNAAWRQEQPNWWRMPLKNMMMLGFFVSAVILGLVFITALNAALSYHLFAAEWPRPLVELANVMISTGVTFYGFLFLYRFAPRSAAKVLFANVWMPALLVSILLQAAQRAFVLYAKSFGNFNVIYGTFGVVIALMLWIYLSGAIMVFGACLCAASKAEANLREGVRV